MPIKSLTAIYQLLARRYYKYSPFAWCGTNVSLRYTIHPIDYSVSINKHSIYRRILLPARSACRWNCRCRQCRSRAGQRYSAGIGVSRTPERWVGGSVGVEGLGVYSRIGGR